MNDRRFEIVQGVWHLIAAEGIDAVTFRRVAAAAGVSPGRVQHYFGSRRELVVGSARAMVEAAAAQHEAAYEAGPAADRLRDLICHALPVSDYQKVGLTVWCAYLAHSAVDAEIAAVLIEAKRGQAEGAAELLRELGVRDPEAVADRLVALADGLGVRVLTGDLSAERALALLDTELASAEHPVGER